MRCLTEATRTEATFKGCAFCSLLIWCDENKYLKSKKCVLTESRLSSGCTYFTISQTPTLGGVRDPSCHQLDAEHPICS